MGVKLVGSITKAPKAGRAVVDWVKKKFSKKSDTITSIDPAKNLKKRREDFEDIVKAVDKYGKTAKSSKIKRDAAIKVSNIHTKYEKASSEVKKYNKNLKRKTIGAGAVAVGGITGAHGVAKHKSPKYKKFMERNITIKDGKVKLVPYKKK